MLAPTKYHLRPTPHLSAAHSHTRILVRNPPARWLRATAPRKRTEQLAAMAGTGWEVGSTPRLYLADPYNEMLPPSIDPQYIRNVSTTIFRGMTAADSNAVWVAQAWFLGSAPAAKPSPKTPWGWDQLDAFLNGPPLGRLLMLDLNAVVNPVWRRTKAFLGVRASPLPPALLFRTMGSSPRFACKKQISAVYTVESHPLVRHSATFRRGPC